MGRWDRRWIPRRRYNNKKYRDYDYEEPPPSPPSPHHPQSNPPPILENGSFWEIDFCKSVGVSWKKVLAAKNFMHCYENVVKWDDSAAEEAFHDAKRRYWEKIHCLPCETPLPDKDMYNDEINWNPYIDPNLISDLDWEYFNPDEVGKPDTLRTSSKGRNNSVPVCAPLQNDENPDELPRETDAAQGVGVLNRTMQHWGQCTKSINSKDITNPWEQSCTLLDKSLKNNAWDGSIQEVGNGWIHTAKLMDSRDVNNPWEQSRGQFDESLRNNAWKGSTGEDPTQGVGTKSTNLKDLNNPWEQSLSQFDKSLTTNAWKGYAVVDPQGVRTQWGPSFNSIDSKEVNNPWEQSLDRFDDSLNNARKGYAGESPAMRGGKYAISINPKDVNPWEQSYNPVDESLGNNAWKDCPEESGQWRKESAYNKWSAEDAGDKQWVHVNDRSRGQKQWFSSHEQQHPVSAENTWRSSFPSHSGASRNSRGWTEHGNKSWGGKQAELHDNRSKNVNYKGYFGGRAVEQSGCRKREGPLQHSPKHKTSRFHGDSYMTAKKW